jgi:hypothetical protein
MELTEKQIKRHKEKRVKEKADQILMLEEFS